MRSLRDEPLVRFVALGLVVLALDRGAEGLARPAPERIEVTGEFVEGLRARHTARGGGAATDDALVREFVRDEALYREAVSRGLAVGDPIVRRRLVQALELVLETELVIPEPDEAQLEAYLAAHGEDFESPGSTTLEHVFFARGEGVEARAADALARIEAGADPATLGDAFLSGRRLGPADDARLDAVLGEGAAAAISSLPLERWSGPIEGALGLHLVRVLARAPRSVPRLEEIRGPVAAAWERAERAILLEAAIDEIAARYEVVREDRP